VSDQDDGPPGPDDDDATSTRSRSRSRTTSSAGTTGARLASLDQRRCGDTVLDASQYTDEWWAKREQQLARSSARRTPRRGARADAGPRRDARPHGGAVGLALPVPALGGRGSAQATIDTSAMQAQPHVPRRDHARSGSPADQRRLGERERDDDRKRTARPRASSCSRAGTGGGKTTAAAWLALKSGDAMPGFIRASELERRGRYDKDLRVVDPGAHLARDRRPGRRGARRQRRVPVVPRRARRRLLRLEAPPDLHDEPASRRSTTRYRAECAAEGREPEPQIRERYGARVRSRIVQIGQWAECGNTDLREGN
jgi:hypothetical protein